MTKAALLFLVLAFAACGGAPKGTVRVALDEFEVVPKPSSVDAGQVRFEQTNPGTIDHELVVIKTDLAPDELPLRAAEVDLKAPTLEVAARDERLRPGAKRTLRTRLRTGRYVLICNVPGHYQSGMRVRFEVD